MADPEVAGVFRQPFAEQVAFFRRKLGNLVPTRRWDDMIGAEHDNGFMVAGAIKAELLADLGAAVDKAISEGTGLDAFRKDFDAIVARNGWTDYTGSETLKGRAWRVSTIYRTNMSTSYAAGRFAQLTAGKFPLWVYRHGGSVEPRVEHLGWDGTALKPESIFWTKHYPPSEWGCSCYVVGASSVAAAKRLGATSFELPANTTRIDPKTGAPAGIGRGWDYAPRASVVDKVNDLVRALDRLPAALATGVVREWQDSRIFERWAEAAEQVPEVAERGWPLVRLPEADAAAIGSKTKTALLSPETLAKQSREHPEIAYADYRLAQGVVEAPTGQVQDGPLSMIYIQERPGDDAAGGYVLVVKATGAGAGLFVQSFRRLSRKEAVRDRTIGQLLRRDEKGRR